jgi:hypothetical protein
MVKAVAGGALVLIASLVGCQANNSVQQGGGGGARPSPSPSVIVHGPTGGPASYGGPSMGGMDPDGIGPGTLQVSGGGGGGGGGNPRPYIPTSPPPEDPNVNPINKVR